MKWCGWEARKLKARRDNMVSLVKASERCSYGEESRGMEVAALGWLANEAADGDISGSQVGQGVCSGLSRRSKTKAGC